MMIIIMILVLLFRNMANYIPPADESMQALYHLSLHTPYTTFSKTAECREAVSQADYEEIILIESSSSWIELNPNT